MNRPRPPRGQSVPISPAVVDHDVERTGLWDETLRWGGEQSYTFEQQLSAPAPGTPYFQSHMLARAWARERPRAWTALMQCSFDSFSEFAVSTVWTVRFTIYVGVGQTNVTLDQFVQVNPSTGAVTPLGGATTTLFPFPTVQAFWPTIPGAELMGQISLYSTQSGSPAPFSGRMACLIAPVYPKEGGL